MGFVGADVGCGGGGGGAGGAGLGTSNNIYLYTRYLFAYILLPNVGCFRSFMRLVLFRSGAHGRAAATWPYYTYYTLGIGLPFLLKELKSYFRRHFQCSSIAN